MDATLFVIQWCPVIDFNKSLNEGLNSEKIVINVISMIVHVVEVFNAFIFLHI